MVRSWGWLVPYILHQVRPLRGRAVDSEHFHRVGVRRPRNYKESATMAHSHDDRTVTRGLASELARSPVTRKRSLAPTMRLAEALAAKPATRSNGLMPSSVRTPHPGLSALARALSTPPSATRFGEALSTAKPGILAQALATHPGSGLRDARPGILERVSPSPGLRDLRPRVPSLLGQLPCDRPQTETRLVRASGTREDWAKFDDGHMVGLTKC